MFSELRTTPKAGGNLQEPRLYKKIYFILLFTKRRQSMISVELWTNPVPRIPRGMSETHRNSHCTPESNYQHTWMGFVLRSDLNSNLNWPRSKRLWKVSSPTKQVMFCSGHANLISGRNMWPWFFSADKGVTIVVACVGCWPSYAYFIRLPQARTAVQLATSSPACKSK